MKLAVSHIGWPVEKNEEILPRLIEEGVEGLEIAPSKLWEDTWNISFFQVENLRKEVERYGLKIVGLHALLYDHPELCLFKGKDAEIKSVDFLAGLGKLCSDLGGKTLVFGSGPNRRRGQIPVENAMDIAVGFFSKVSEKMLENEVCLCIEPLGSNETDFIDSAEQALRLIKRVDHEGFRGQLDTKSLYAANEINVPLFEAFRKYLVHVHINDPGLVELGSTGLVNHEKIGKLLKHINYDRFVSIEQKTVCIEDPFKAVLNSIKEAKRCYLA